MSETTKKQQDTDIYAMRGGDGAQRRQAPTLPYQPIGPKRYRPKIGLIGCGGITAQHLSAYRDAGYNVAMLCDLNVETARKRQRDFYPDAEVCTDYREVLSREEIDVVDLAPHPEERAPLLEESIDAGKHVLSHKPFVLDLDFGQKLVDRARQNNVKLAVNQNGRWAPHWCYIRRAIEAGVIGSVQAADLSVHWNHNGVAGTPFDEIHHLLLYDFAIHWFDIVTCFMGEREPTRVYATINTTASQQAKPALLGHVVIEYEQAAASLVFRADTRFGPRDRTMVVGERGTLESVGPNLNDQSVTLTTDDGIAQPVLEGSWFPVGFQGTMSELLCAIEADREPENSAAHNLRSLSLCFAALASADRGEPVTPGSIRRIGQN